jgi:hypothetical protein
VERKLSEDAPKWENKRRRGSNSAEEKKLSDKQGLSNGSGVVEAVK